MSVKIDQRIELLSIVQYLGDYDKIINFPLIARGESEYRRAIDEHFGEFKKHKAVKLSDQLASRGFGFDAPVGLILQFSELPELSQDAKIPETLLERTEDPRQLFVFIEALRDFAKKSNFLEFFSKQETFYEGLIETYKDITDNLDFADQLKRYLNLSDDHSTGDCSTILAPLNLGNYSSISIGKTKLHPYSILGFCPKLIEGYLTKERIGSLSWHEFGHTYINPLTSGSMDLVEQSSPLFTAIEEKMRGQAYPEWKICINEIIIRAITGRLVLKYFGEEPYRKSLEEDTEKGFIYLKEVEDVIASFEKDDVIFPSIKECHRVILLLLVRKSKELKEESEEES